MYILWFIIILDLIVPFVPITALFLIYILMAKPLFFKKWVEKIYTQEKT